MRPHVVLQLRRPLAQPVPHWERFISNKRDVVESFGNDLDVVFGRHRAAIWVTAEYQPDHEGHDPSPDEVACGLHRTYRVILHDRPRTRKG